MRPVLVWSMVALLVALLYPPGAVAGPVVKQQAPARPDFFGIVGRDPLYALTVDGRKVADEVPLAFLDRMAAELAYLGARWVRIEFHSIAVDATGPGVIDYSKYDAFIQEIAPRHGLQVLALLNSGTVRDSDPYYWLPRLEDPPDGAGVDATDRSNNYIRVFTERAREIADRYGDAIAAYELFNEPNINSQKLLISQGQIHEISPERFATLATNAALAIKGANPRATVVLGGMLHGNPIERPERTPSDYLADVYASPRVQWFAQAAPLGAARTIPWDAVALHPYGLSPVDVESHVREVKARLVSLGDPNARIWITEIGWQGEPPPLRSHWLMPPTTQEAEQAAYLTDTFGRLLAMPEIVERVFWFKYEDFREEGLPRNWGLVRLRETPGGFYDPSVLPYPRKPAYLAYQQLANPDVVPTTPRTLNGPPPPDSRYFPQTGQLISGPFLRYWEANGGLGRFGLPVTSPFEQGGLLVQYFERARFEYHPEYAGSPNEVQLGFLGLFFVADTALLRPSAPLPSGPAIRYFAETRHNLANGFKAYWEANNGLRFFGMPVTEELRERNPIDGRMYTVQYFERARLEHHPENSGTPFEFQVGLLGRQVIAGQFWYR